jgi:hypothetical protein
MQALLPEDRLEVRLAFRGGDGRELKFEARGDRFSSRWAELAAGLARFR